MFDRFKRKEVLDPTPVAIPLKYTRMSQHNETIRAMIRSELSRAAENADLETFEEADDFEVEDYDPRSPFEQEFEGLPIAELKAKLEASKEPPPVAEKLEALAPTPGDPPQGTPPVK